MARFGEVISTIAKALAERVGADHLAEITIVRDATGQATVIVPDQLIAPADRPAVAAQLAHALGPYSAGANRGLVNTSDLIDLDDILGSPDRIAQPEHNGIVVIDRLLSNQDWLRAPPHSKSVVALAVAYSIKGGVGRSTALAVLGWHLARLGKRVVVIDLDLAAPGIGTILLGGEELPDYGLVDWLIETIVDGATPDLLNDSLAKSTVADDTPGSVTVLPAFGSKTTEYISKLGRVHLPSTDSDGRIVGIADRLSRLVSELAARRDAPDVVLLDSRAGLDDMGAAAVTQLGAEAFLFARDDFQSWAAYRHLFNHLRLSRGIKYGMPDADLRWRLKTVAAQLETDEGSLSRFVEMSYSNWSRLYDDEAAARGGMTPQLFARDDTNAPHYPLPIYYNAGLKGLILAHQGSRPSWPAIETAFAVFLRDCTERLLTNDEPAAEEEPLS